MVMQGTPAVSVNPLMLFYVWNGVVALALVVGGGTLWVAHRTSYPHPRVDREPRARQILLVGLGGLWIVDGLLQAQPLMVTAFVRGLLVPLLPGQPPLVAAVVQESMRLWRLHPLAWDLGAVWLQIGLGCAILLGGGTRWRRVALWMSTGWGLLVWIAGKGVGSLLAGGGWFVGSPGSAILYALAAGLLLLPPTAWVHPRSADWGRQGMAGLWLVLAGLQAWPPSGWWSRQLSTVILNQARMPQPAVVSAPLYAAVHLIAPSPRLWNAAMVGLFLLLAAVWGWRRPTRFTWSLTVGATFVTWWVGQDLGVFGGMGTDPNSGAIVLLGLMAYAGFGFPSSGLSNHDRGLRQSWLAVAAGAELGASDPP